MNSMNFTGNHDLTNKAHIAKTRIIRKEYQGFEATRSPKAGDEHYERSHGGEQHGCFESISH